MQSVHEPEPHHRVLHRKMKDSFCPTYLTVLSVIQGVALADLASVVATNYQRFTVVHWLLVVFNFVTLISVWDQYVIQGNIWDWVPDIRDATIPFVMGALELVLNHTIILSLSAWLLTSALLGGFGALATWHAWWRAGKEADNARMLSLLRRHFHVSVLSNLGGSLLGLLLAVASSVGDLEASAGVQGMRGMLVLGIVLLVAGGIVFFEFLSIRNWSRIVAYARTGHMPGMQTEDPAI